MTVKDLRELLNNYPDDMPVGTFDEKYGNDGYVFGGEIPEGYYVGEQFVQTGLYEIWDSVRLFKIVTKEFIQDSDQDILILY